METPPEDTTNMETSQQGNTVNEVPVPSNDETTSDSQPLELKNDDWTKFMKIMRKARDTWSNSFTYTLIESEDIPTTWL